MVRKVFTELKTPEVEKQFNLVELYVNKKQELDKCKKELEELSNLLKLEMKSNNVNIMQTKDYKVTKVESQRVSWKEDLLLAKVKTFNRPELIKQVEQVDVPALEQAVLDETISIGDLLDCQTVTEVVTLRMSKVKENKDE